MTINPTFRIDTIGGNCPVQAEGKVTTDHGDHDFYFRARGRTIRLEIAIDPAKSLERAGNAWHWQLEMQEQYAAGWISEEFARACIKEGAETFITYITRGNE